MYVDDTLASGDSYFEELKEKMQKSFESNKKEYLPVVFTGITVNKCNSGYFLEKTEYAKGIKTLKTASFDEFITRHKIACLIKTRLEVMAGVNIL